MTRQQQLNLGLIPARNLMECLSVDFDQLLSSALPQLELPSWPKSITRKIALAASAVHQQYGSAGTSLLAESPSDTLRGIAATATQLPGGQSLSQRLASIRPFADDSHFGVREWAWMAVRPHLAAELDSAIQLLTLWTQNESANLRRFAVESLRPRGVWCSHIESLKAEPRRALCLLDPLRADTEKYVQDSVANWLNDASKSQPDWVRSLCARWISECPVPPTIRIVKRALRNLS